MNQKSDRLTYEMNNRKRNAKNGKKSGLGLGALGLYLLLSLLSAADGAGIAVLVLILAVIGIGWAAWHFGKKYVTAQSSKTPSQAMPRKREEDDGYCKTCSDEFVYNNRQAEYNEHAQEDSLLREQQRRLRQLDGFLKNGLIDQKEYELLRARYEKELS